MEAVKCNIVSILADFISIQEAFIVKKWTLSTIGWELVGPDSVINYTK